MKNLYFLMLSAFFSLTVNAGEWTRPEPVTTSLSTDTDLYLYNVGKGMFFTQGNEYGAQGSVSDQGFLVRFSQYEDANGNWDGKTYIFSDFIDNQAAWFEVFIETWNSHIYTDRHNDQPDYLWELDTLADNTYRIYPADLNPNISRRNQPEFSLCYTGVNVSSNPSSTVVDPFLDINAEDVDVTKYYVDWQFVTPEAYNEFQEKLLIYYAAIELEEAISAAEEEGIDVEQQRAIADNPNSSYDELVAAKDAIAEAYKQKIAETYTPTNPLDMDADYIVNTTFDDNIDGWQTTTQNGANYPNHDENVDGYYFTNNFWLNWNGSNMTGKMFKTLTDMPEGVYHLKMAAYSQAGKDAYVYLFNDSTELITPQPFFYEVSSFVFSTNEFEIGLSCPVANSQWIGIDNVHLEYYGNNIESYNYITDYYKSSAPDYSESYCYKPLIEEYKSATTALSNVTDYESAVQIIGTFKSVLKETSQCVNAYSQLENLIANAYDMAEKKNNDKLGDLAMNSQDHLSEGDLVYDDVIALCERLEQLTDSVSQLVVDDQEEKVYPGSLMCIDPGWGTAVWSDANRETNASVKGFGTYTVTEDIGGSVNGVTVFVIDIIGAAERFTEKNTIATIDKVTIDETEVEVDNSKVKYGDLENNGNFRIEIYNDYGPTNGDPAIDKSQMVGQVVSVTFTLSSAYANAINSTKENPKEVSCSYYTTSGVQVAHPQKGINIVRKKMSDGTITTIKVLIK